MDQGNDMLGVPKLSHMIMSLTSRGQRDVEAFGKSPPGCLIQFLRSVRSTYPVVDVMPRIERLRRNSRDHREKA